MNALLFAGLISTLSLDGEVPQDGGDYLVVPFEVPAGTVEIVYRHADGSDLDILDFGLWDGAGTRGWGGGNLEDAVVGVTEASRSYVPGPIAPGTWYAVIGKARLESDPATYAIELEFHDRESLVPRPRAEPSAVVLAATPGWYAGDVHVHSRESGDATASFDEIHALARERGLDWVVLSDHNIVTQHPLIAAYQQGAGDLLFVRGCEITTYAGHGNGVGISSYVDHRIGEAGRTIDGVLDDVAGQGGLFIVNHPALDLGDACIGCAWDHDTDWSKVAAMELHTGAYQFAGLFGRVVLARWDALFDDGFRVTGVAGSDDHRAGMDTSSQASAIGSPTTVVYADELSEAGIMAGIAAGRAVIKLRGPDDPMIELTAIGPDGEVVGLGGTATGAEVEVRARVTGGAGLSIVFVVDGVSSDLTAIAGDDALVTTTVSVPAGGGRVRAHVVDGSLDVTITNHVFLAYAEPGGDGGCGCRTGGRGGGATAGLLGLALLVVGRRRR